jgi:hypothetical protein
LSIILGLKLTVGLVNDSESQFMLLIIIVIITSKLSSEFIYL